MNVKTVQTVLLILISLLIVNSQQTVTSRGALRLVRHGYYSTTQAWNSGIVQIYYNDNWGNICDDTSFGRTEADVICHQLSYTGASTYTNTAWSTSFGTDSYPTLLEDVSCLSSDLLVLLQCSVTEQYSASCSSNTQNDVIVHCYTVRIWDDPFPGQIRLVGGNYSNTGLLQVYCNGQWGTVCDDYDNKAAIVSCNQLGYNDYTNYDHLSIQGKVTVPIWTRYLYCSSSSLLCVGYCGQCPSSPISGCTHFEDVTLDCAYSSTQLASFVTDRKCEILSDTTGPSSVGAMRLLNDGSTSLYNTAGRVQVWYGGQWGNICYSYSFGYNEADVICHQLGWSGASGYSNTLDDNIDNDNLPTVIDNLDCNTYSSSEYLTIFQCSYNTKISSSCTSNKDVSVTCYTTRIWDSAYTGQIRLSRGQYSNQGLLEVYCNGQWGTVCDDSFGFNEANVACRQLGYDRYYSYNPLSITGNSTQPIWFDNVQCSTSSLKCLANCIKCPSSEVHNCVHSKDITLECTVASSSTYSKAFTCKGVDHGPTHGVDHGPTDNNSSDTIVVLGSIFFIISIAVGIIVCIVIFRKYRAKATQSYSRFQPQPVTAATVATQSANIPSLQVPLSSMNPIAPNPDQLNPPYNPQNTAADSNVYGQDDSQQYSDQPRPGQATPFTHSRYTTTPQQPPPSYSQSECVSVGGAV